MLRMGKGQTWITSMPNNEKLFVCPVCGYGALDEAPYDSYGCASYSICPCCGTEFGYDDSTIAHSLLQEKWVNNGAKWWSNNTLPPDGWDPVEQINNLDQAQQSGVGGGE
jgi:hypothetical protein